MTDRSEWVEVVKMLTALWPHSEIPDNTLAAWYEAVEDLPMDQVVIAVTAIAREGREFAPTGGMIRQRVLALREDSPQWGDVWRWLRKAQMKAPALTVDPDRRPDFLRDNGQEAAAEFMAKIGWPTGEEWTDPNLESRLRRKWEEWQRDRAEGKTLAGLPAAGLARIEREHGSSGLGKLKALPTLRELEEPAPINGGDDAA
jgi:hypothetical protein